MNLVSGRVASCLVLCGCAALAQEWDRPAHVGESLAGVTNGKVSIGIELRGRYEQRTGMNFGREPDLRTALMRERLSLTVKPAAWVKISAMLQDSRAPGYGDNAPSTVRDPVDLQESYIELFPDQKKGLGLVAGRMMINYGEGRLIGSPQWGNLARTWDQGRAYLRTGNARFEILLVSPVKVRIGEFNEPVLGDRIWGTYNAFSKVGGKYGIDVYVLRHDQNRPGGFSGGTQRLGTDRLGVTTFGGRLTGPLRAGVKYSFEGAIQRGEAGPADHHASAWFGGVSRRWTLRGRALDVSAEYKYASGTRNPADLTKTSTFDQLYPANHDKFGHDDLFGWRNLHNVRSLAILAVTKKLALSLMYNNNWLASARDALYNSSGRAIVASPSGGAGRHVGQEADLFATYKYGHFLFGGGYGHFFNGEFIRKTTPGASPTYAYVFHTYSF